MQKPTSVDAYIESFPPPTQKLLQQIRAIIQKAAPKAEEVISYGMPAYKQHGLLVYFAGYAGHIGFYPTASPIIVFAKDLKKYKTSKGAIQFPLDAKIPATLVQRIVKYRIAEDHEHMLMKKKKK